MHVVPYSREDILLTTHDFHGSFVCIGVELLGIFISAVIVKVSGVHIKNQFPVFHKSVKFSVRECSSTAFTELNIR